MRIKMASALFVFLPLICSPHPAAAQFNPSIPPMTQTFAHKLPAPGKFSELQSGADSRDVRSNTDLINKVRTLLQRRDSEQRRFTISTGIQPAFDASRCAHIDIIPAPDMDSKMIKEIPKEFASNMPMWHGSQPCCEDFRGPAVNLQGAPFVGPGRNDGPAPSPASEFFVHRP